MVEPLLYCFLFYSAPVEIEIAEDRVVVNEGVRLPVGIFKGNFYTVDANMKYIELEITDKMYGELEVCKVKK